MRTPTDTGRILKLYYDNYVKAQAEQLLQNQAARSSVTLPEGSVWSIFPNPQNSKLFLSLSSNWVSSPTSPTLDIGLTGRGCDGLLGVAINIIFDEPEQDALGTVGRGRVINPRYKFIITKQGNGTCRVSNIQFRATIEDLYDFSYETASPGKDAAAAQMGYGAPINGINGKIFRHMIDINATYEEPFTYY